MEENAVDIWKQSVQKDNEELKSDVKELKNVTRDHDRDIREVKSTLADIKDDTKWLRRTITNAIIMTVLSAVIGGSVAIVFGVFKG